MCSKTPISSFLSTDTFTLAPVTVHYPVVLVLTHASICLAFCFYTLFYSLRLNIGSIWDSYAPEWLPVGTFHCAQSHSQVYNTELKSYKKSHPTSSAVG